MMPISCLDLPAPVNGVGAKMALTILSGIEADDFARCIQENDSMRLTRLPGVGKKTAERLIIEMRDRLKDWDNKDAISATIQNTPDEDNRNHVTDAISALISLGYKPQEASRFVHSVATDAMESEEIIREALKASVK
jgi:Holliday junction DNA helicase RuvA